MDAGSFLYGDGMSLLEVYLSVAVHTLPFEAAEEGAAVSAQVDVAVYAASGEESAAPEAEHEQRIDLRFEVAEAAQASTEREHMEQIRVPLPPGEYDVVARVAVRGERATSDVWLRGVEVPDYDPASGAAISSVQLASSIARAEGEAADFVKSGLEIQPNPRAVYAVGEGASGGMRSVPYYAEVYGVDGVLSAGQYTVLAYLAPADSSEPMPLHQQRTRRPVRPVDVVVGRFDISDLPTGTYWLRVVALDASGKPVAERGQKLRVVNPNR